MAPDQETNERESLGVGRETLLERLRFRATLAEVNKQGITAALHREAAAEIETLTKIANQARHWLAWFDEPAGAKTWDLNIVAAGTRALLRRLDEGTDA